MYQTVGVRFLFKLMVAVAVFNYTVVTAETAKVSILWSYYFLYSDAWFIDLTCYRYVDVTFNTAFTLLLQKH